MARNLATLARCVSRCQIKQADALLGGRNFDEEACEQGNGSPLSCRAAFDRASAKLLGARTPTCPLCLDTAAQSHLADLVMSFFDQNNGLIYCAGSSSFGGDDTGFVPPNRVTASCEDAVATSAATLMACAGRCQIKQADSALQRRTFNEDACEEGTGRPTSCRAIYDRTTMRLLDQASPICPLCLNAIAQTNLANLVVDFIDQYNGLIYCAGTLPLPSP